MIREWISFYADEHVRKTVYMLCGPVLCMNLLGVICLIDTYLGLSYEGRWVHVVICCFVDILFAISLRSDVVRSREIHNLCPDCGYDWSHNEGPCPECGRPK